MKDLFPILLTIEMVWLVLSTWLTKIMEELCIGAVAA
jgi:hypothetical protein